jgi:L-lactate utilization protein LutB
MSYKIILKKTKDYFRADVSGKADKDGLKQMSQELREAIWDAGLKKIFINVKNFEGRHGIFESLHVVENLRPESKDLEIAILDVMDHKYNNDFFENAAMNRGYKILFFYDEDEAMKWLQIRDVAEKENTK